MAEPAITVTLSPGLQELMRRGPAPIVHAAVARALDRENEYTIGAAVRERMSFPRGVASTPEGLRVQTGFLRRSIHRSKAVVVANGANSAIGSNVKYFGVHEFGFNGTVEVREHRRQLPARYLLSTGQVIDSKTAGRAGFLTRKGKLRAGLGERMADRSVVVKAHTREARVPARRMVRRTVEERFPAYAAAIQQEVIRSLSAGPTA